VENVQHDAMLTLGDPTEGNHDGVVILVPLVGSLMPGPSGDFIAKIARYMPGVLQPSPTTGQYESLDIPTDNNWALSSVLPGTPGPDGKTVVTNTGYYVWSGSPPLVLRPRGNEQYVAPTQWPGFNNIFINNPNVQSYSWQVDPSVRPVQYVMLSRPVLVNSIDLQTIRMLPMTPPTEAVAPILKHTLSYRTASSCPPATPSAASVAGLFSRETMENQCDPFAPGAITTDTSWVTGLFAAFATVIALAIAIYAAVWLFTDRTRGEAAGSLGAWIGNMVSNLGRREARIPATGTFSSSPNDASKAEEAERKAKEAAAEAERKAKAAEEEATRRARQATAAGTGLTPVVVQAEQAAEAARTEATEAKEEAKEAEAAATEAVQEVKATAQEAVDGLDAAISDTTQAAIDSERDVKALQDAMKTLMPAGTRPAIQEARDSITAAADRIAKRLAEAKALPQAIRDDADVADALGRLETANTTAIRIQTNATRVAEAKLTKLTEVEADTAARERWAKETADAFKRGAEARKKKAEEKEAADKKAAEEKEAADKKAAEEAAAKDKEDAARKRMEEERAAFQGPSAAPPAAVSASPPPGPTPAGRTKTLPIVSIRTGTSTVVDPEGRVNDFIKSTDELARKETPRSVYDMEQVSRKREASRLIAQESSTEQLKRWKLASEKFDQLKLETESSSAISRLERLNLDLLTMQKEILETMRVINANPPTRDRPNVLANQRLEGQLNTKLKFFHDKIQALEAGASQLPDPEVRGLMKTVRSSKVLEEKALKAQSERLATLTSLRAAWKGGRRPNRKSTRRYVA
jgi:cell division protein FtsL